jgi:hypothetical protein
VRSHEELVCWQIAYELKLKVYELVPRRRDFDRLKRRQVCGPDQ